eukprot:Clim_evm2s179 gene=Clim_evmTU2s179
MKALEFFTVSVFGLCALAAQQTVAIDANCTWNDNGLAVIPDEWILDTKGFIPVKTFIQLAREDDGIDVEIDSSLRIAYRADPNIKCCQVAAIGDSNSNTPVNDKYFMIETLGDGVLRLFYTAIKDAAANCVHANAPALNEDVLTERTTTDRREMWKVDPCASEYSKWVAIPATLDDVDVFILQLEGTDLFWGIDSQENPTPNNYFINMKLVKENDPGMFFARFLAVSPDSRNYPVQSSIQHGLVDVCYPYYWSQDLWLSEGDTVLDNFPDCLLSRGDPESWTDISFPGIEPFLENERAFCH